MLLMCHSTDSPAAPHQAFQSMKRFVLKLGPKKLQHR